MKPIIENKSFDQERALYNSNGLMVKNCRFDGPADGESAFKECRDIEADHCFFNLRYPFWHDDGVQIRDSEMTELCRAALWYSKEVSITNTKLHGILISSVLTDPVVSATMKLAGISSFASGPTLGSTLLPILAVAGLFVVFAYLAAGKIKRVRLTSLMSE